MTGLSFSPELQGHFLRHSTCPNFDWLSWNHSQTTWIFHHPNSPVISPDKAGTLLFFPSLRCSVVKGWDSSNASRNPPWCTPHEVTTFPCFGTWKVERKHGKPSKIKEGLSWNHLNTINKHPGNDAGKLASTLDESFPPSFYESMNMKKSEQRQHANMKYLPQLYTPKKSRFPPPPFNILCMLGVRPRCGFIHNFKSRVSAPWSSTNAGTHSTSVQL